MRYAVPRGLARAGRAPLGFSWREPQVHCGTLGGIARDATMWRNARGNLYVDGGATTVITSRAAARHLLSSRRQLFSHRNSERRGDRHQHGHEPAIRFAAKQSRRRSRCRSRALRGENVRHHP